MKAVEVSRSAQYISFFRAIENNNKSSQKLFNDPLAIVFLDIYLKFVVWLTKIPIVKNYVIKYVQKKSIGAYSIALARTKYIDDLTINCIKNGIKQVLLLGAGFDTRGLRLQELNKIPFIEIDHPNTSFFKLNILKKHKIKVPENITFYQLDFNKMTLNEFAKKNKINFTVPTLIIWEGVTPYLKEAAVNNTFEFAKNFCSGSYIIFTYVHKAVLEKTNPFNGYLKLAKILNTHNEGWTFGFYPDKLPQYLENYNVKIIEDLDATKLREKYIFSRKDLLRGFKFHHTAIGKIN